MSHFFTIILFFGLRSLKFFTAPDFLPLYRSQQLQNCTLALNTSTYSLSICSIHYRVASMTLHLEQAMDQADAHITLSFVDVLDVNLKVMKEMATSENNKPLVYNVNEPARTSTSVASIDAIDMNLKGPQASLIRMADNRKCCFARQRDDHVAKVHKPNVSVQVKEKVTPTSKASMDAHDMYSKGVKGSEDPVVLLITTAGKL